MISKFLRFGLPPKNGKSWNYRDNIPEIGVSCYRLISGKAILSLSEVGTIAGGISDRPIYFISGEEIGSGSDGEPIVKIHKITRVKGGKIIQNNLPFSKGWRQKTKKEIKKERSEFIKREKHWGRNPFKLFYKEWNNFGYGLARSAVKAIDEYYPLN